MDAFFKDLNFWFIFNCYVFFFAIDCFKFTFTSTFAQYIQGQISIKAALAIVTIPTHGIMAAIDANASRLFLATQLVQV